MNTIGLCSVFQFINKKVDAKLERYYKLLHVPDGQPYTSKHYFFNDGSLTEKIHEFLALDVAKTQEFKHAFNEKYSLLQRHGISLKKNSRVQACVQ